MEPEVQNLHSVERPVFLTGGLAVPLAVHGETVGSPSCCTGVGG